MDNARPRPYFRGMSSMPAPRFLDRSTPPTFLTLIAIASITAMAMNMFLPSLPAMTEYFQTEYRTMQLSVAVFLAVNAFLQLFIGPISDRFGRRPVLIGGMVIYLIATLACIYAPTAAAFLWFRMLQATVVVSMVLSRAIVRDLYEQDRAASMIGYVTMGMAVVPMLTPALGGWLDEHVGWQANFWAMLIAGLVVLGLILADSGETNRARSTSFAAQFADYPELLASPRFWGYSLSAALSSGAFFAYLGGAPFVGSVVFGLTPTTLGVLFGAPAIGYVFGNGLTGRLASRVGINRLILIGTIVATAGVALAFLVTLSGLGTAVSFFGLMTLLGFGNGLVLPNATAGILSVRPQLAGTASGLGGAMMIGGGAALSALAGSLLKAGGGPEPLLWIMLAVTSLGIFTIYLVILRERRLGIA